jgi:hypothetical protein
LRYVQQIVPYLTLEGEEPLSQPHLEHGIRDSVCGRTAADWVKEWIEWLICEEADRSPLTSQYNQNPFDVDARQGRYSCRANGRRESVWFLAGPVYGGRPAGTYTKWVVLPPTRRWHILATPFTSFVSSEEYPSLNRKGLYQRAKKDIDSITALNATLDGEVLNGFRLPIKTPFQIQNIPPRNVMSLSNEELERCNYTVTMCADGQIYWLNPLDPGLHILHLSASSPVYEFDVKFQLNVRAA